MLLVIHCMDRLDAREVREAHYPAHRVFIASAAKMGVQVIMSGPLVTDDGKTPIGSLFVVEAPNRPTAESFHRADPFFVADVWQHTIISAFDKKLG